MLVENDEDGNETENIINISKTFLTNIYWQKESEIILLVQKIRNSKVYILDNAHGSQCVKSHEFTIVISSLS
uniref:Uncharacterized protein n=1 Tax=Strongyloides venezuelensis TaxID=75913 RepID=A0A0K0G5N1_STRVS